MNTNISIDSNVQQGGPQLFPWLARTKQFGYCDNSGKNIINSEYDAAQPFENGYAIVQKEDRYGLIDRNGTEIIQAQYPYAQLFSNNLFTLLVTKKEYNAWWRFWNWKLLPEFNALSTGNRGPFLVTKMPKAKWEIWSLPDKKRLFHQTIADTLGVCGGSQYWKKGWSPAKHIPSDIPISAEERSLIIKNHSYQLDAENVFQKNTELVFDILNDGTLLVYKGEGKYIKLDRAGKAFEEINYVQENEVTFNTPSGGKMVVKQYSSNAILNYPSIAAPVFKGNNGGTYLFPDLSKPLPPTLQQYQGTEPGLNTEEIIKNAIVMASIPGTKYFFVTSICGQEKESRCFLFDIEGNWNTQVPAYTGLESMHTDGRLLFTKTASKGVLYPDLTFFSLPLCPFAPCNSSIYWYVGKDMVTEKYGVFDVQKQQWQVKPEYNFLLCGIAEHTVVYDLTETDEEGLSRTYKGLIDIKNNRVITPAIYDAIDCGGAVSKTENGQQHHFYVNVYTGQEYRE